MFRKLLFIGMYTKIAVAVVWMSLLFQNDAIAQLNDAKNKITKKIQSHGISKSVASNAGVQENTIRSAKLKLVRANEKEKILIEAVVWELEGESPLLSSRQKLDVNDASEIEKLARLLKKRTTENCLREKSAATNRGSMKTVGHVLAKEIFASLSTAELTQIQKYLNTTKSAQKVTHPQVVTPIGRPVAVLAGSHFPVHDQKRLETSFVELGLKLDMLPSKTAAMQAVTRKAELSTINLCVHYQQSEFVEGSESGSEKIAFKKPGNPNLLFRQYAFFASADLGKEQTLLVASSDFPDLSNKRKKKKTTLVFISWRIAPPALDVKSVPISRVETRPNSVAQNPTRVAQRVIGNQPGKMKTANQSVAMPARKTPPVHMRLSGPSGCKINLGDQVTFENHADLELQRNFEILKANLSGISDAQDYSVDFYLINSGFSELAGIVDFEISLTEEDVKKLVNGDSSAIKKFVTAPNVGHAKNVPFDKKIFLLQTDVTKQNQQKLETLMSYSHQCASILINRANESSSNNLPAVGKETGVMLNYLSSCPNGLLDVCELEVTKAEFEHAEKNGKFDLYGSAKEGGVPFLIRSDNKIDAYVIGSHKSLVIRGSIVLSEKDAAAFQHLKKHGRLELRKSLEQTDADNLDVQLPNQNPNYASKARVAAKVSQANFESASDPLVSQPVPNVKSVLTKIDQTQVELDSLKSDLKKLLQVLDDQN